MSDNMPAGATAEQYEIYCATYGERKRVMGKCCIIGCDRTEHPDSEGGECAQCMLAFWRVELVECLADDDAYTRMCRREIKRWEVVTGESN